MKKAYTAPLLEVEVFELNAAIATGCTDVVNVGPGDYQHDPCTDFGDIWGDDEGIMTADSGSFYENTCHCYYSSGGEGWMTS